MGAVKRRLIRGDGTTEAQWNSWPGLAQLPAVTASLLVPAGARALVVAPHPDDEVLSVGGLLAQLARSATPVHVVAVTDGTASHPDSREWPVERLANERPRESRVALRCLGVENEPMRLGLPDGGLRKLQGLLASRLLGLMQPSDVVFTTWRRDGHPDHEATAHACAFAATRIGAQLVEVPVWGWHWAVPGDARVPWHRARRLLLDPEALRRKRGALQAFASQLHPDASTGAGPILRATTVGRVARAYEVLLT